jgi:hypothetical protein
VQSFDSGQWFGLGCERRTRRAEAAATVPSSSGFASLEESFCSLGNGCHKLVFRVVDDLQ